MANIEARCPPNSPAKPQNLFLGAQILLRIATFAASLASTYIMITNKQTFDLGVFSLDAKYSYSPASKFLVYANIIVCAMTVLSSAFLFFIVRHGSNPAQIFLLFLIDMLMMGLTLAGVSAATAIGYLGKYGNSHSGWMPVCDHFQRFCKKGTISIGLAYLSLVFLVALTITSASKSRQILV